MKGKIQEINLASSRDRKGKLVAVHKKRMPIVRCVCGCEILVVPDLKAMNLAINNHVAKHKSTFEGQEGLMEFLAEQVLIVASKTKMSNEK
jgi:hypothetical protein